MISSVKGNPHEAFPAFLEQDLNTELLRFTTAGSVDDGKSTLIGRLLHDSKSVYEDQLASVKKSRINRSTGPIDFSRLTGISRPRAANSSSRTRRGTSSTRGTWPRARPRRTWRSF
jgi:hypothetical protein